MKKTWPVLLAIVVGVSVVAGARAVARPSAPAPARTDTARHAASVAPTAATTPTADARPSIDLPAKLANWDSEDIGRLEEELEARLREDRRFGEVLFDAFLLETDPMKMSFLLTALASDPRLRNDPAWQDRVMRVAEGDASLERRKTALLFVQEAEAIATVRDRMFALAESGEVREHALVALKGLPDRRLDDPRLRALAARIIETERDPETRGLAIRIEGNPERAARLLADPEREVRAQAAIVATSREAIARALAAETDEEVRDVMERRLAELGTPKSQLPNPN
jgi:hypothetical protein